MASIHKTTAGTWQVRWRNPDGKTAKKNFKRRADADTYRVEVESTLIRHEAVRPQLAKTPLADWITQWHASRLNLRPSTANRDQATITNHIIPRFGARRIGSIQPEEIRRWVADLSTRLSPATVQKTHGLLKACLERAAQEGRIGRNPCANTQLPKDHSTEMRHLSVEEIARLADAMPDRYTALVLTATFTGLRWGELAALRVSDLDLLRRRLTVSQTVSRDRGRYTFAEPKTGAARRSIFLPTDLVEVLAEHLHRYGAASGLVFTSERGAVLRSTNFRKRIWLPALDTAGLVGVRFHALRHTAASLLIAQGAHPKAVQERLGHSNPAFTLRVYSHLFEGIDEAAAESLNGPLREALAPVSRPFGASAVAGLDR